MRRSRGFTLAELLTALIIHSFFIVMLGGFFYTLISFGSRAQSILTARERGQRVIDYIDSRVRRTGLGLWKLESSSEFREAFPSLVNDPAAKKAFTNGDSKNITLPIIITHDYQDNIANDGLYGDKIESEDNILRGNILTLLYSDRDSKTNFVIKNGGQATLSVNEWDKIPKNATQLKGKIFQPIQGKIRDYYAAQIPGATDQEKDKKSFDDFWEKFFDDGLTEAKHSFDISVYNSVANNQYQSLLKSIFYMYDAPEDLNLDNQEQSAALTSVLKDLLTYVNTNEEANILISRVTSVLEKYFTPFNSEFKPKFLDKKITNAYVSSRFRDGDGEEADLRSYGTLRGTGKPVLVQKNSLMMNLSDAVLSGDELLHLKSVRLYATNPSNYDKTHGQPLRNCKIQKLNGKTWGNANPYQQGILEIYAELDQIKNILSVWVLSMGGQDNATHERPYDWPEKARWREQGDEKDYRYFITYVSKGTWKLNNLPEGFRWD